MTRDEFHRPHQVKHSRALLGATALVWIGVIALLLAPEHVHAKKPPEGFAASMPPIAAAPPPVADGAIFHVGAGYAALVEGSRARHVGDPITVLLIESTSTSKSAGTKTQ